MKEYNELSLTRFAATMAKLIGVETPACADAPIDWVCDAMSDLCKEGFDRVLFQITKCHYRCIFKLLDKLEFKVLLIDTGRQAAPETRCCAGGEFDSRGTRTINRNLTLHNGNKSAASSETALLFIY